MPIRRKRHRNKSVWVWSAAARDACFVLSGSLTRFAGPSETCSLLVHASGKTAALSEDVWDEMKQLKKWLNRREWFPMGTPNALLERLKHVWCSARKEGGFVFTTM